jgi:hypothetical protein
MRGLDKRILKLHEAEVSGTLVHFRLAYEPEFTQHGYVVGVGATLVLFHIVEANTVRLNGYMAVLFTELRKVALADDDDVLHRALRLKQMTPRPQPDILLLDLPGLVSSANTVFPLVNIHPTKDDTDVCFIGRVERVTDKAVTLYCIDKKARWCGSGTYKFKDITRVEFGGGYEEALWNLAESADRPSS